MIDAITAAVEQVESRGQWYAQSGCHRGVMQVCTRWAKVPPAMLWIPEINRREGKRLLLYWHRQANGDWSKALAAYNCGWRGLQNRCGKTYARRVLVLLSLAVLCACDPVETPPAADTVTETIDPYGDENE